MKIVRGRLAAADVSNPMTRYNPDCDCVEFTPDGGETWNRADGLDPRRAPQFLKPPLSGVDARCDSAANKVKWLKDFIDEVVASLHSVGTVLLIVGILLDFIDLLFPAADIIDLIVEAGTTIASVGSSALDGAFSATTYDELLCIFFCHAGADGTVSDTQLTDVQGDVTSILNATAAIVVNLILEVQGRIGLSNAGTIGAQTGACGGCDCGWCLEFDFKTGLHGWTIITSGSLTEGHQEAGIGIVATVQNDGCSGHGYIQLNLDIGTVISNIDTVEIVQSSPNWDAGGAYYVDQDNGGTITRRVGWGSWHNDDRVDVAINDGTTYDHINIVDFQCGQNPTNPQVIEIIRFKGMGTPPSVGVTCP